MKKLLAGIIDFRKRLLPERKQLFAELAKGQNPDVLFITCSDSRVAPNWFASTDPGDLFVVRNVGNLIPPADKKADHCEASESVLAAAEFAVLRLNVTDIVVCGHSECGAMMALLSSRNIDDAPHLKSWLNNGKSSVRRLENGMTVDPSLSVVNQLSQSNVLQQIEHLKSYPFIRKQIEDGKLQIHGWWFDIATANVYSYNKEDSRFQIIE